MTEEEMKARGLGPWADAAAGAADGAAAAVADPLAEANPYARMLDEAVKEDRGKRRAARIRASAQLLRETDDTRLDDIGKAALFRAVASGIAGIHVHNPSEMFGTRATADMGGNIALLRRFADGEWDLLDDPEVVEWRKAKEQGEEAAAKYAHERIGGAKDASSLGRGMMFGVEAAAQARSGMSWQGMQPALGEMNAATDELSYDKLDEEGKAKWRRERIEAYERKMAKGNPVATFLRMTGGLDDEAKSMVERAWRTGELKREELSKYDKESQQQILGAVSLMRGDQKEGTLLLVPGVDVSQPGWKANLYALQQSVLDIPGDLGEMAGDLYRYTRAKMLSGAEREEAFRRIDMDAQIKAALEQPLVEPETFKGAVARGLAENIWFILPGMGGAKGAAMMRAAQGVKKAEGVAGWLKNLEVGLTPWKAGSKFKAAAKEAEATAEALKYRRMGLSMAVRRQTAAMANYTESIRKAEAFGAEAARRVPKEVARWWGGRGVKTASDAAMFQSFFREHVEAADAAGVSREDSVPLGLVAGWINALVEQLHMPGQEDNISAAELKYLMSGCSRAAFEKVGREGFKKWAERLASRYLTQTAKVTAEEGLVEEPIQQLVNELGIAIGKRQGELRKEGQGGIADAIGDLWAKATVDGMAEKSLQIFADAAWDALPGSLGFGLISLPHSMARQKVRNWWTGQDEGIADAMQRAVNMKQTVEEYWSGAGRDGPAPQDQNPHRFEEAVTAARRAWRDPQTGDVVKEIADAAGVDVKTAEVMAQYFQTEADMTIASPKFSAWSSLNMSLADIDEATIRTVLPGYVEGSFASDPENGIYSGRVRMEDGTEKTIAYRVGDWSEIAGEYVEEQVKDGSNLGKSWDARIDENGGNGTRWADLTPETRRAVAITAANGLSTGKSGIFELTDSKGEKVRVNADDIILLANGRLADIGYGAAATQGTVRHETFHSLWRFVRGTLADEDVQQLAKSLGVDVTADGWENELDEIMGPQMERYASGHYVSHAVSSRFDKMMNGWAGKVIGFFSKFGPSDEVTDPKTGKPYQLKGLYDRILRGELGSGALGVELRKVESGGVNSPTPSSPTPNSSRMPVEVTDADRAAQEAEMRGNAAGTETSAAEPATAENPAVWNVPNQQHYIIKLPNSDSKIVGRLEVRDVDTGVFTSWDEGYHDPDLQNRAVGEKASEQAKKDSEGQLTKISSHPDPLLMAAPVSTANDGIPWALPNGDMFIGNHRVQGLRIGYEKGTAGEYERYVREDAAKRGIEIGADVKRPLLVFILEGIDSTDGKMDIYEVVRLANRGNNQEFGESATAKNDAKVLIDNNLLPRMKFRADGQIDETKSGDAIGKFITETGAREFLNDKGMLTDSGERRLINASMYALLGSADGGAVLQEISNNFKKLDMQSELRALMKMTPELMALAEVKPAYDLRAPLVEALQLFTEWRDKDETARVEKGKTRHDWRETAKDGHRVRGLSWEAFMSQGDMFRKPSEEAKILGDLFAKAESLRSFDREDVESEAGKKRVVDLISGYLADYIENARAVNTETDDMFGGSPASRAEIMAAQRTTGGTARFSVEPRPVTAEEMDRIVEHFGTTSNFNEAGYILPDGKMLDLSGRNKGATGGRRTLDHRDVWDVIDDRDNGGDAMADFVSGGAIRLQPEAFGVMFGAKPTEAQEATLMRYFARFNGEMNVDIMAPNGDFVSSASYSEGTRPQRILNEVKRYYDEGTELSGTGEQADGSFRYSIAGKVGGENYGIIGDMDEKGARTSVDASSSNALQHPQDIAYLDAVSRGDMKVAQRMVDEAFDAFEGYRDADGVYHYRDFVRAVGYRLGDLPSGGRSYNVRDNIYEDGVSLAGVGNLPSTQSFAVSGLKDNDANVIYIKGDVLTRTGGDDEFLMRNARVISKDEYEKALSSDRQKIAEKTLADKKWDLLGRIGADRKSVEKWANIANGIVLEAVVKDDAGNVIPLSQRFGAGNFDFSAPNQGALTDGSFRYSVSGTYNPRSNVPSVRGGWNEKKILRYLKANPSLHGVRTAARLISEFDTVDELKDHMFYHGTRNYVGKMQPSMTQSERWAQEHGGGGYGQRYWGISVSKSKKVASNFGNPSPGVSIYPVVLAKGAKVIDRPDLTDAADVEDHIVELWNDGVDAVRLGDWSKDTSEQELLVLNPRAICNIGTADSYRYFQLGSDENPIDIKDDAHIARMLEAAKDYADYSPTKRFGKPVRPDVFYPRNADGTLGEMKPRKVIEAEKAQYEKDLAAWRESEQGIAASEYEWKMREDIRYSIGGIYTGSAADYEKPSLHHVGTGEGNQVYGWGLYGSTERGVAEGYAQAAARDKRINQDETTFQAVKKVLGNNVSEDALQIVYEAITGYNDWKEVKDWLKRDAEYDEEVGPLALAAFRRNESALKKVHDEFAAKEHIYEQTFFTDRAPGDESHLLKWYDSISDENWDRVIAQAEKEGLRDKLKGAWWLRFNGDLEHFLTDNGNSGDAIYESLSRLLGSPKAASEFLARAGIDGVKYPVDSFGGKTVKDGDEAGWNYVSFRDDNIRVDHKWTDGQMRFSVSAPLVAAMQERERRANAPRAPQRRGAMFSTEAPKPRLAYPQLRDMSDDELLSAAVAVRMALGASDKFSDRAVKIHTVQKMMRRLHPDWDTSKIGLETQRVILDARKFGKRIREDLDRGVSDSLILEHLPQAVREQFGREMRQEARRGQSLGAFGQKVASEIEKRQEKIVEDAVRVQTGLDAGAIENAFGINLSETIMHLAENQLNEKPLDGAGTSGSGTATDGDNSATGEEQAGEVEIDAKVKAVVDDLVSASRDEAGRDVRNREDRRAAAGRDAERRAEEGSAADDASSGEGDFGGDELAKAVRKAALDLENPRHLARLVAELTRRQWIKEHHLAQDAEVWRDLVAVQFLRKTAQSVYAKLVRDLTYSRSRETAMGRIAKLDNVPTVQGLLSEMEFVGALVNAQRIRDTQKAMCEKLDLFLREKFGAQGRFKPDKEEGKRSVSAEAELRARYMRHAMWLTPDAAAEEARRLQETLDALSVDFKDAGRDVDQSREFVETIRKMNVLREFGALRYKPVGEIEAAAKWWEDFARGESDDIVREMLDRDIRTRKAAYLLAVAFADPKRTTIREGGKADALNRFITGHMGFISLLQDCMRHASDADAAAAKDIIDYIAREIQKSGDRSEAEKRRHNDAFHAAVESIYGKGFSAVMKEMMAPDERFTKYMGTVGDKRVTPTKGRAMQLLVSLLQEGRKIEVEDEENPGQTKTIWEGGYHDNIVKNHREGQAADIMKMLDPADMNMLKWLGQWYENNRSDLSDVCHSLFGIGVYAELPNYFPVKMQLATQGLEKGQGVGWTIFPKALTPRVRNERDFDTSADIFSMWAGRMEEAAQWKHHAQLGLELRGIFGRSILREAVRANHGASVDDLMQGFITDILAGHGAYDRSTAGVQYFSDQIRGWTALCALGGNIGVMAKQTTSIPAFGFEIGLVNTAKYMVSAFTPEGMAAMAKIWDSEQRRTRWNLGSSEAVRNALNQQDAGWLKRALQASMVTTKVGDVVPALVIGQGIYRDCLDRGMSEDDAMAETWSIIERTQQSGRMENQTSIQRRNKLGRIMFQFLSTQQQYLQYEVRAIREVIARPDSVKRWGNLGRAILLNHFILSSAYFWVGELYKRLLGQEPPEDELKDWVISCLLGPYGSLFVAGFCCKYTLERAIKGYSIRGGSSMLPMESWLKNQVNDGAKLLEAIFDSDGDTWDDMLEAAGRWMSDSNSVVRDLRKIYRYRIKGEPQKK